MTCHSCQWCINSLFMEANLETYLSKQKLLSSKGEIPNDTDTDWCHQAYMDLQSCFECVVTYHNVVKEYFSNETVSEHFCTLDAVHMLDLCRLKASLTEQLIDIDKSLLLTPLKEILKFPRFLLNAELSNLFVQRFSQLSQEGYGLDRTDIEEENCILPGLYLLLIHPVKTIQRWAMETVLSLEPIDCISYDEVEEVVGLVLGVVNISNPNEVVGQRNVLPDDIFPWKSPKEYWIGVCMLLKSMDKKCIKARLLSSTSPHRLFVDNVLAVLQPPVSSQNGPERKDCTDFWPALQIVSLLLDYLGVYFWQSTNEKPSRICKIIVGHVEFIKQLQSLAEQREVMEENEEPVLTNSQYAYNTSCVSSSIQHCQPSSSSLGVAKEFAPEDLVLSWVLPFVTSIISFGDNVCNPVFRQILAALNAVFSTSVAQNPRVKPSHLLGLQLQAIKYPMTMFTVKRKLTNMTLETIAKVIKVLFERARYDFLRSEKTKWLPIFSAASNALLSKSQSDGALVFSDREYSGLKTICDVLLSIVNCPVGQTLPCHSKYFTLFSPKMRQKLFRQSTVDFIPPFPPTESIQEFVLTVLDMLIKNNQIVDKPAAQFPAESLIKQSPPPQMTPPNQTFQALAHKDEHVQMTSKKKRSLSLKKKRKLKYDSYSIMDTSFKIEKQADSEEEMKQSTKPESTRQEDAPSTPSNTKKQETGGFSLDLDEISQNSDCEKRPAVDSGDCKMIADTSKPSTQGPTTNRRKRKCSPRKCSNVILISSDDSDDERLSKKSFRLSRSFHETESSAIKMEPLSSCHLYPVQGNTVTSDPSTTGWVSTGLKSVNQLSDFVNSNSDSLLDQLSSSAHSPPDLKIPSRSSSESNDQLSTPCKLQHVDMNLSDCDTLDDSDDSVMIISDPDVSSSEITRKDCLYNKTFALPSCASEGNQIVTQPRIRPIPISISVKKMTPDNIDTVKKRCKQGNLKVYSPFTKNKKECEEFLRRLGDKKDELVVSLPIPKDPTGKKRLKGNNSSDTKSSGHNISINLIDRFFNESDLSCSDGDSTTNAYPDSSSICDSRRVADQSLISSYYRVDSSGSSTVSCDVRSLDERENDPAISLSKVMDPHTGNKESFHNKISNNNSSDHMYQVFDDSDSNFDDSNSTTKTYPDSSSSIDTRQVAEKSSFQRDSNNDTECCTKPSTHNCGVTVRPRFSQSRMKHFIENINNEPLKNPKSVSFLPETVHSCIPTTNVTRTSSTSSDTSSTTGQLPISILKRTTSSATTDVTQTSSTSSDTSTHGQLPISILKRTTSVPSSVFQRSKPPPNLFAEILKWPLEKFDGLSLSSRLLKRLPSKIPTVFKDSNQYNSVFFNVVLVKLQRDMIDILKHLGPDNRIPIALCAPPMSGLPLKCQYIVSSDECRDFNDLLAKIEFVSSSFDQSLEAIPPRLGIVTVSKTTKNLPQDNNKTGTITFDLKIQLDTSDLIQTNATEIMVTPIFNLAIFIRQWSGISDLPKSRLLDNILSPKGGLYFGLIPLGNNIEKQDHLHGQVLDHWQELAVKTAVKLVTEQYIHPRIYLLEGAPGTGKTHTIANMIPAILKSLKQAKGGVSSLPGGRSQNHPSPHLLVCASTDFGADEIVRRMIRARLVCDSKGKDLQSSSRRAVTNGIKIVRLGDHRRFAKDVSHLSLQSLMKEAQTDYPKQARHSVRDQIDKMTVEVESHESTIKNLRNELHQYTLVDDDDTDTIPDYLRHPNEKDLNKQISRAIELKNEKEEKLKTLNQTEQAHHKLNEQNKKRLLLEADVICSTLITTGRPEFRKNYFRDPMHFNCIIIDEASYCSEVDTLIPIAYRPTKLILVGDPIGEHRYVYKKSGAGDSSSHGRSMFERMRSVLKTEGFPLHSLQIQYRSSPLLFKFPLTNFYPDALITSANKTTKFTNNDGLVPFKIFDVQYSMDTQHGSSNSNEKEVQIVVKLVENLIGQCVGQQEIGIITPYISQERLIRTSLNKKLRCKRIEIGRTDLFQGKEKTAVVLSCVKTNESTPPLGFLSDSQEMNIALTRSREILYIVARCDSLKFNENWNRLIAHAKATGAYTACTVCDDIKDRLRHSDPAVSNSQSSREIISSLENVHSVANTLMDIDESSQDIPVSITHPRHTSCTPNIERNITTTSDEMANCTVNDSPCNDDINYDAHDPVCCWPDDSQIINTQLSEEDHPLIVPPHYRPSGRGPKNRKAYASTEEIDLVRQLAPAFREMQH